MRCEADCAARARAPRPRCSAAAARYTCGWGGAFGGGCRPDMQRRPTAADLEYAKAVLSLYDVVLVMEVGPESG